MLTDLFTTVLIMTLAILWIAGSLFLGGMRMPEDAIEVHVP